MLSAMTKRNIIRMLAAEGGTKPEAADHVDRTVERILRRLKKGEVVALPGLGRLVPGPKPSFHLEKLSRRNGAGRGRN